LSTKNNILDKALFKEINPLTLSVFRIVFGIFAFLEVVYFYKVHLIEDYIIQPKFLFNYDFLPVEPLSESGLQIVLALTLISTVCIALGFFYRLSLSTFIAGFSYFFLLDKSYYNNHLYLIILIAIILLLIPANNALALGNKKKKRKPTQMWHLRLIQFQFVAVYFFGGVAKLNGDWLIHHEPMSTLLTSNGMHSEGLVAFLCYSGLIFDLLIGFLLLIKPTRYIALIAALLFNITNHFLFDDINIFPFLMMASLVIFFELEKWPGFSKLSKEHVTKIGKKSNRVLVLVSVYVIIQLVLPLRHYFIPGSVDWTGEGQRFAWRMKIQARKSLECEFAIFDLKNKTIYPVNLDNHIHELQQNQMIHYPRMVQDFAHYLEQDAKENHRIRKSMIKAKIKVKFNQRDSVEMLSPDYDLVEEEWNSFGHNQWISDLSE
jgi:vitamin K-dependent gamma-carboxylase